MMPDELTESDLFECQKCGDCCKGYGGTFVSTDDIQAISDFIGTDPDGFVGQYCQMSGGRPVLLQDESGYCVFWDGQCSIHPVKPRMCKAWPFIKGVLADVSNWHAMANSCPGIKTDIPDEKVLEYVRNVIGNS